jgi:putative oxidoreductase
MSYGILLLRVVLGLTVSAHGAQKLFGWFGGGGPRGTADFFGDRLGFRSPLLMAVLAGTGELGGLAFAAGFLTPFAALGIVVVMMTAIATVHWKNGLFVTAGGYEYNLVLIAAATAIAMTGPGRFSVDRALGWDDNLSGAWWGVGVLGAGALLTGLTIALFRLASRERLSVHAQH